MGSRDTWVVIAAGAVLACSRAPTPTPSPSASAPPATGFAVVSAVVENRPGCGPGAQADACASFPVDNTRMGADRSPPLRFERVPVGTQSFAVALHDLSNVSRGDPFTHWVMWNIPGALRELPEGLPPGATPGKPAPQTRQASFRSDVGFTGAGACGNVYELVVYALSVRSFTPARPADADAVEAELASGASVLAAATLRARCNPQGPCRQIVR